MRTSFHTNAFAWAGETDIVNVAKFAKESGFQSIEVGPIFPLDREKFSEAQKYVDFSAFIYCRNFIDDDEVLAEQEKNNLIKRMEFASSFGVKKIVTSTGISKYLSLEQGISDPLASLDKVVVFLNDILEVAEKLDLLVCLENCPVQRNIATSPYMWRKIFENVPNKRLGLCYDPAHFVWQMIDVYSPMKEFADRIFHLHIKDTYIFKDKLNDVGILHNTAREKGFEENQWWRHTIIDDGEIDWSAFFEIVETLDKDLIDLSFEMEDYMYECNVEKVKSAYIIQRDRLKRYVNIT